MWHIQGLLEFCGGDKTTSARIPQYVFAENALNISNISLVIGPYNNLLVKPEFDGGVVPFIVSEESWRAKPENAF